MSELIYIPILILVVLVILGISVIYAALKNKREGKSFETDYCAFFILGISFLPLGFVFSIVTENPGMFGMSGLGLVYMFIGLANRDKWKKIE